MEIIKHGKTYEAPHGKVCLNCGCEFSYGDEDIRQNWCRKNITSEVEYLYINCPECHKTIIIKDYRKLDKVRNLWVARDRDNALAFYTVKPILYHDNYFGCPNDSLMIEIDKNLYPEITFGNSPQMVELKLVKE